MTRTPKPKKIQQTDAFTVRLIPRHMRGLEALAKKHGTKPATLTAWLAAYVSQPGASEEARELVEVALSWGELVERGEQPPTDPKALRALREEAERRRTELRKEIRARLDEASPASLPNVRRVCARELRDQHAWTYDEIAETIGVSTPRVQQFLTGGAK